MHYMRNVAGIVGTGVFLGAVFAASGTSVVFSERGYLMLLLGMGVASGSWIFFGASALVDSGAISRTVLGRVQRVSGPIFIQASGGAMIGLALLAHSSDGIRLGILLTGLALVCGSVFLNHVLPEEKN